MDLPLWKGGALEAATRYAEIGCVYVGNGNGNFTELGARVHCSF
ncbi:hypothetical protein [Bacteroides acidifaciens]|nr:hypothetical protein [Bacteroides acidifaciens]